MKFYEVGGAVRDSLLGVESKDVDFAVEFTQTDIWSNPGVDPFGVMVADLQFQGFEIFKNKPEFLTITAKVPKDHPLATRTTVADFVLCRRDSAGSDGRRPDSVEVGTIFDDLARRDFTVNAMARAEDGSLLDPHGGQKDLSDRVLRFVGDPMTRIREDGLRVMRALRFALTKNMVFAKATHDALHSDLAAEMLYSVSIERIREELEKMLAHNSRKTVNWFWSFSDNFQNAIFRDGLRLMATLKR